MHQTATARTTTRGTFRLISLSVVVAFGAIIGKLVDQSAPSSAPSSAASSVPSIRQAHVLDAARAVPQAPPSAVPQAPPLSAAPPFSEARHRDRGGATEGNGAVTEDDGVLPDGVTVFDDEYPGVANLDPGLLHALREAATDAADDGITFSVNSGWRSPTYQAQLLQEAIVEYGSEEEAARWVAPVDTSAHVSGDAVDIGPVYGTAWLAEHGATYGLCPIYRNEPWHYELRPEATGRRCPPMYADSAHDPRTQQ